MNSAVKRALFFTEDGLEVPAVTAAQMVALREAVPNGSGLHLLQLIENAGRNIAEWIIGMADSGALPRVLVLAGPDNNGAAGICGARHLANHDVPVALALTEPTRLSGVLAQQLTAFHETQGREVAIDVLDGESPDVVIDALIGYNSSTPVQGRTADAIEWTNAADADIVSLDVPSGVDATTGETTGTAVLPHVTLTFGLPFTGLHEGNAGELILADIGIPTQVYLRAGIPFTSPFERRYWVKLHRR